MKQIIILLCVALTIPSFSCSSFLLNDKQGTVFAKNYDWNHTNGILHINKAHVSKKAFHMESGSPAATWTSLYKSMTFNQYGREFPNGGMNEEGLMVEILWLESSLFEAKDSRPVINELSYIQFILDQYSTVQEFLAHAAEVRVAPVYAAVHYLVCDKSNACATVEFINKKMVVHTGSALPITGITNNAYQDSYSYLLKHQGFGGMLPIPTGSDSLSRFVRLAKGIESPATASDAYQLMDGIVQPNTVWQIVYNPIKQKVGFKTVLNRNERVVDIQNFSSSCKTPVETYSMSTKESGAITGKFKPYDSSENAALLKDSLSDIPNGAKLATILSSWPESTVCNE